MPNVEFEKPIRPARLARRPVQDEWGIYDPEQAGMAAVLRKLAGVAIDDDAPIGAVRTKPNA